MAACATSAFFLYQRCVAISLLLQTPRALGSLRGTNLGNWDGMEKNQPQPMSQLKIKWPLCHALWERCWFPGVSPLSDVPKVPPPGPSHPVSADLVSGSLLEGHRSQEPLLRVPCSALGPCGSLWDEGAGSILRCFFLAQLRPRPKFPFPGFLAFLAGKTEVGTAENLTLGQPRPLGVGLET